MGSPSAPQGPGRNVWLPAPSDGRPLIGRGPSLGGVLADIDMGGPRAENLFLGPIGAKLAVLHQKNAIAGRQCRFAMSDQQHYPAALPDTQNGPSQGRFAL